MSDQRLLTRLLLRLMKPPRLWTPVHPYNTSGLKTGQRYWTESDVSDFLTKNLKKCETTDVLVSYNIYILYNL